MAAEDGTWLRAAPRCADHHEERLPEVGKYNAGQKMVFWSMSILIIVLISSGIVIWDQYFYQLHDDRAEARGRARPLRSRR